MKPEPPSLSDRLERLEQQNRRLRWLLFCLPLFALLLVAQLPKPESSAIQDGTAAAPSISFGGDPKTGLFWPAPVTLALSVGGVERMR